MKKPYRSLMTAKAGKGPGRKVFRRFFGSFLILCMMPVIAAIAVNYTYVLNLLESGMEQSNTRLLGGFSRSIDVFLGSLEENAIAILSHPSVNYFLNELEQNESNYVINSYERMEAYHDLSRQLTSLSDLNDIIDNAYLYFIESDFVLSPTGAYRGDLFFDYEDYRPEMSREELLRQVSTRNMMDFLPTMEINQRSYPDKRLIASDSMATYVVGFPFLASPKVALLVNLQEDSLRHLITVPGQKEIHTFILNREGRTISRSHNGDVLDPAAAENLLRMLDQGGVHQVDLSGTPMQVAHVRSRVNDWSLVSMVSLEDLRQPALLIRNLSLMFFLFIAIFGGAAAYFLSRVLYHPIGEIFNAFRSHGAAAETVPAAEAGANELDLIRIWSETMIDEKDELTQQLQSVQPLVQETIVMKLVQGQLPTEDRSSGLLSALEVVFPFQQPVAAICIELLFFRQYRKAVSESERTLLITNLKLSIRKALGSSVLFAEMRKNLLVCIVAAGQDPETQSGLAGSLALIGDVLKKRGGIMKAVIAAGTTVDSLDLISGSFTHAQSLLRERHLNREIELLDGELPGERSSSEAYLTRSDVDRLRNILASGDAERLRQEITEMLSHHAAQGVPACAIFEMAHDILHTIVRFVGQQNPNGSGLEIFGTYSPRIGVCVDIQELSDLFGSVCGELFPPADRSVSQQHVFQEVRAYILRHYRKELSLETFANRYGMSLGYFSRRFKEVTGEKYVHFVNRIRVEKAKELLEQSEMKVEEIATEVGFAGKSFIVIFKKHEGVTPGKYRTIKRTVGIG